MGSGWPRAAGWPASRRPRALRAADPPRPEVLGLRSSGVCVRHRGQEPRSRFQNTGVCGVRAAKAHSYLTEQPFPRHRGLRVSFGAAPPEGPGVLHDPGFRLAADFRAVHRQRRQVAFLVRTLSGKPDPQGFRIHRHADPNQEPCEKQSRAGTEEERRLIPRGGSPQSKGRPTLVISTSAALKAYSASVFSLTLISHEEACTYAKVQLALRTFSACHRPCSRAGLSQVGDFRRLFLSSFGRRELQWRQRLYLLQPQQLARRPGRHWRLPQWSGG